MKIHVFALLLIGALLLGGCASNAGPLDAVEDSAEKLIGSARDTVERTVGDTRPAAPTEKATQPHTAATTAATLTREEAEAIALEHAGFTADQVTNLHTEYEIDNGVPQYEVDFHQGTWEYDYEINAETGAIMSFEKDD